MEDPDVMQKSFAVEGGEAVRGQKNPRDEPVGGEMGGDKNKPALEKPPPAPRAAASSTFDGLGVRGGLSLAGVTDEDLMKVLQEPGMNNVSSEIIALLLDADMHKHNDAVGLRKALEEEVALQWSTTIEKLMEVVWLSSTRLSCA
jgi:hypothetical protein